MLIAPSSQYLPAITWLPVLCSQLCPGWQLLVSLPSPLSPLLYLVLWLLTLRAMVQCSHCCLVSMQRNQKPALKALLLHCSVGVFKGSATVSQCSPTTSGSDSISQHALSVMKTSPYPCHSLLTSAYNTPLPLPEHTTMVFFVQPEHEGHEDMTHDDLTEIKTLTLSSGLIFWHWELLRPGPVDNV